MTVYLRISILCVLFIFCVSSSSSSAPDSSNSSSADSLLQDQNEEAVRLWLDNFRRIKKMIASAIKAVAPALLSSATSEDLQVSPGCRKALFLLVADLRNMKPWALRMLDASAKMVNGILTGTMASFGSFDQCVETIGPTDRYSRLPKFQGQYCTVQSWPPMPPKPRYYPLNKRLDAFKSFENDTGMMGEFTKYIQLFYILPFRLGICVPSTCSAQDIHSITNFAISNVLPYKIEVPRCEIKEETVIEYSQIPMLCISAVLGCLLVFGTLVDVLYVRRRRTVNEKSEDEGALVKVLLAFSGVSNFEKILDTDSASESLNVLHGIRFYSICWIILGHTFFHLNFSVLEHLEITIQLSSQASFGIVTNASLVVDNFFFISGLLMIYVTMDMMKKLGKLPSPIYFILHRLWRFFPIQMLFVGVTTLLPLFGDGPIWHENIDPLVESCKTDWWTNLIFVNNLYRSGEHGCVSHSWYLAADFQLYLFCIPIVLMIIRRPKIGLCMNFAVMMLSIWTVGLYTYFRDLPPTMLFTRADVAQRTQLMREIYYPPYQHLAPFCIGIFIGYYLQSHKGPLKLHWLLKWAAWLLTFVLTSLALFGVHSWNSGMQTSVLQTVMYACLSRVAWTLGLAWIVLTCSTGCGGVMTKFLRWKALIPFSRLTFLAYMVHPFIQHVFYSTLRNGIQAKNHVAVFICFGFIVTSYGIGLMLCLLVEAPLISLGKVMLDTKTAYDKQNSLERIQEKKTNRVKKEKLASECPPRTLKQDINIKNNISQKTNFNIRPGQKEGYNNSVFVCHL